MANEFKHGTVGTSLSQAEWEAIGTHVVANQAVGDIIYADTTSQLLRLGIGSTNQVLTVASGKPSWAAAPAAAAGSLTGSALASGVTASSLTSVGTIATGVWQGTTVAVDQGGTGATTLANLIALTTMTTGNYVATVTGGTGITSTGGTTGEGIAHSLSVDASQTQITSVGALGAGTIASGFGTINNGSSTITTTGAITGGSLVADNVTIDGNTISTSGNLELAPGGDIILNPSSISQLYHLSDINGLSLESQTSGSSSFLTMFSKDRDGTDNVGIEIWGVESSGLSNRERLEITYVAGGKFRINTDAAGTGTARNFEIQDDGTAWLTKVAGGAIQFPLGALDMNSVSGGGLLNVALSGNDWDSTSLRVAVDTFSAATKHMVVGHTATVTGTHAATFEILGTDLGTSQAQIGQWSDDAYGPAVTFIKSHHGTIGAHGADIAASISDNDLVGRMIYIPDDGTDFQTRAAQFHAEVDDASPETGGVGMAFVWSQMPGGGTTAMAETMRITAAGKVGIGTATPAYPLTVKGTNAKIQILGAANDETIGLYFGRPSSDYAGWFNYHLDTDVIDFATAVGVRMKLSSSGLDMNNAGGILNVGASGNDWTQNAFSLAGGSAAQLMTLETTGSSAALDLYFKIPASGTGQAGVTWMQGSGNGDANNMAYQMWYAPPSGQLGMWSADIDGSSTGGNILGILDGTNDWKMYGGLSTDGLTAPTAGITTAAITLTGVAGSVASGVTKAYCTAIGDGTLQSNSFNITSVANTATGKYTVTWDTDFANTNYVVLVTVEDTASEVTGVVATVAVGYVTIEILEVDNWISRPFHILAIGDQ